MAKNDSLHILLIHQAFISLDEAGGTRHAEFARHLVEKGHRVTVIASPISYLTGKEQAPSKSIEPSGLTILRARSYSGLHRSFFHRLINFFTFTMSAFFVGLRVKDVDLVWGSSPPIFQALSAFLLSRIKAAPFLFEIRDLWPSFAVAVGVLRNPLLIRASAWLEKFLYRKADQILVNSPGFIQHIHDRGGKDIALIPNGADPNMFNTNSKGEDFRRKHRLKGRFVVLYAGAHGLSNDLGVVLQAAKLLQDQSKIAILLLGDGKDKTSLIAQSKELNLSNLHFLDPLPKSGMAQALAAADACLAILKPIEEYKTVYPNKVFDYMAAGRPTILAIDGVIRNVVEEGGAGIFVPPGDPKALAAALDKLASDPKLAARMGRAARAHLEENFNRKSLAAELESLIASVVKRS